MTWPGTRTRHHVPRSPRQRWRETRESWERSAAIVTPPHVPSAPPEPGGLRVAFLTYRGNPRCGGQGVYTRHLTRELRNLGHSVEVLSGQPWPELDEGVGFTPLPGLDLYRDPDPFRIPHPREVRDRYDALELGDHVLGRLPGAEHLLPAGPAGARAPQGEL